MSSSTPPAPSPPAPPWATSPSWPEALRDRWRVARSTPQVGRLTHLATTARDDGYLVTLSVHDDQFDLEELRDGCVAEAVEVHRDPGGPALGEGEASVVVFQTSGGRVRVEGTCRYPRHGLDLRAERMVSPDQLGQAIVDVCREVHLLAGASLLAEVAARSLLRRSLRATRSGHEASPDDVVDDYLADHPGVTLSEVQDHVYRVFPAWLTMRDDVARRYDACLTGKLAAAQEPRAVLRRAAYQGAVSSLRGETALVSTTSGNVVLAQFDRPGLSCGGRVVTPPESEGYAGSRTRPAVEGAGGVVADVSLGWHEFAAEEFAP